MSEAQIYDGIAATLWSHVGGDPDFTSEAIEEAAADLVDLYIEANGVPLDEIAARIEQGFSLEHATRPNDLMIGAELAARSLRKSANRWGVVIPWFEVRLVSGTIDDGEIEWEGDVTHRNPVGDRVEAVSGPARGQRGVVRSESARVAQVELDSGRRVHLERSALRTRGR